MANILITGAQFSNKGAQSLLFNTINEVKEKYNNINIIYLPIDWSYNKTCFENIDEFAFDFAFDDQYIYDAPTAKGFLSIIKRKIVRSRRGRAYQKRGVYLLSELWQDIDILVDVSGYQISSKFLVSSIRRNLRYFDAAKKRNIPVILLPQSFGPFKFSKDDSAVLPQIINTLNGVDLIFAREEDGKKEIEEILSNDNIELSADLVLQASNINIRNIYTRPKSYSFRKLVTKNNVGIIPNVQTTRIGNEIEILSLYKAIISYLLSIGKEIYIFKHSDDLELCRKIYDMFEGNPHCILIEDDMDCFEYSMFVKQFDFIVASRYHAIVHAYKESIPALVLGWAVKYDDLSKHVLQQKYVYDITSDFDKNQIIESLSILSRNFETEKNVIRDEVSKIQSFSCFSRCWEIMDSIINRDDSEVFFHE